MHGFHGAQVPARLELLCSTLLCPLLCCTSTSQLPAAGALQHTPPQDQKIVLLEHNTTIGDALKTLAKHNILSAPMASGRGVGRKTEGRCHRAALS